jgi:cell wall-associated NlpC family hydrolase
MNNRIVTIARTWLGTPYHHQASVKGVGCDCLGLVRGVYAEAYGHPAEEPPAYTRDLAEACQRETLLEAARRHLVEIAPAEVAGFAAGRDHTSIAESSFIGRDQTSIAAGDVVVFRLRPGAMAKHCGIISARNPDRLIHAFENGPVCEVNLSPWWRRKIAAAFRFPQ